MTTNEMIYKTISTKLTKTPKYKDVLEDMGFRVYDSGDSVCGCWTVGLPETNRIVLFSKGYDNKKRLYGGYDDSPIHTTNPKMVDYVGLLKSKRIPLRERQGFNGGKYADIRWVIGLEMDSVRRYEYEIERCERAIARHKEDIREHKQRVSDMMEEVRRSRQKM